MLNFVHPTMRPGQLNTYKLHSLWGLGARILFIPGVHFALSFLNVLMKLISIFEAEESVLSCLDSIF